MSTKLVRDVKIKGIKWIGKKYDDDAELYNDVGVNMTNTPKGSGFQSWIGDAGKSRCAMAYNTNTGKAKTIHQLGGTGICVTGTLT